MGRPPPFHSKISPVSLFFFATDDHIPFTGLMISTGGAQALLVGDKRAAGGRPCEPRRSGSRNAIQISHFSETRYVFGGFFISSASGCRSSKDPGRTGNGGEHQRWVGAAWGRPLTSPENGLRDTRLSSSETT